jgi:hypothetical protein
MKIFSIFGHKNQFVGKTMQIKETPFKKIFLNIFSLSKTT